jgi:ABC-type uncharacterized transport system involved in gliding motility auxiliary subunit
MIEQASFSAGRRWSMSLNALVTSVVVLALVLMINYLAARHFTRFSLSQSAQVQLSPQTLRVLGALTNEVKVTVYFDKQEPVYDSVWGLLKEYSFRNSRIKLEQVDYERDPGRASLVKSKYRLHADKDLVIFEGPHGFKVVPQTELSDLDIQPLISGQSQEARRTHFKGELMFTSAIFNVTSARPMRAYFLRGHGEHSPEDQDSEFGYGKFAEILKQNGIETSRLTLLGTNEVPAGGLLIAAAPMDALPEIELNKIDQYLKNGGRMLALFNVLNINKAQETGLEKILANWGVEVGRNLVQDRPNSITGNDIATSAFGNHPIVTPLYKTHNGEENARVHLAAPRTVRKIPGSPAGADAANVTELFFTGPEATVFTDIREGEIHPHPSADLHTNVSLAVAVEKGKIRNVSADRGTTRIVVVGDSIFWGNRMMESASNRDFAFLVINWLLDRSELLAIPPRPIKEYKLTMTQSQLSVVRLTLLAGMPGAVLLTGLLVWVRRRK